MGRMVPGGILASRLGDFGAGEPPCDSAPAADDEACVGARLEVRFSVPVRVTDEPALRTASKDQVCHERHKVPRIALMYGNPCREGYWEALRLSKVNCAPTVTSMSTRWLTLAQIAADACCLGFGTREHVFSRVSPIFVVA
jgi:hypothetical protein